MTDRLGSGAKAAFVRADCADAVTDVDSLSALRGARVLVTGGTGFMGTWLAETIAYLNDEHGFGTEVFLLSRRASEFAERAPHLAARGDVSLLELDVRDLTALPEGVSLVVHAAGTPDNRVHATDPLQAMSTIAAGASAVLRAAADSATLEKVLLVSSGLVYGPQPLDLPCIGETWVGGPEPDSIQSVYAEAKRYAEAEAAAWRSSIKLPVVTARPFAFIGPYQGLDKPWAVNNFLRDALLGGPIRILGDAETVRSYLYPSDMAFWLLRILVAGVAGTAYNVGSPDGVTLGDLARRIACTFDPPEEVALRPLGALQLSRFVPDVSRAQSSLGLTITLDLAEAIVRTLEWYRGPGAP